MLQRIAVLFAFMLAAARVDAAPIVNYDEPLRLRGAVLTEDQVRDAWIAAGQALGWKVTDIAPGALGGTYQIRTHTVEVEIGYSATRFSVAYKSSINMRHQPADNDIHPAYNTWVGALVSRFKQNAERQSAAAQAALGPKEANRPRQGAADTWEYALTERGVRGTPKVRSYVAKVTGKEGAKLREEVTVDGARVGAFEHGEGSYLIRQGVSIFSPYLPTFTKVDPGMRLGRSPEILDDSCKGDYQCRAETGAIARETVEVPAGKFDAVRIRVNHTWQPSGNAPMVVAGQYYGSRVMTVWYAPSVGRVVKVVSRLEHGAQPPSEPNFDLELVSAPP